MLEQSDRNQRAKHANGLSLVTDVLLYIQKLMADHEILQSMANKFLIMADKKKSNLFESFSLIYQEQHSSQVGNSLEKK